MHVTGNAILLSDVHLSEQAPDITRRFVDFLTTQTQTIENLFILGDLFEVWIGDDAPGTLGLQIAAELNALAKQGIDIYFMPGNRDFLIGPHYAQQAGMQLLEDPCTVQFNQKTILLAHGDAWCTDDIEYQKFRAHRLQPETQQAFLAMPVEQRLAFAQNARDASQKHTANSAESIMDVNPDVVDHIFHTHGIDTIIHGHTHRPADHQHGNHHRMVLGDWYSDNSWLEINSDGIHRHGPTL